MHRAVYLDLAYYKNGHGVVKQCSYYAHKSVEREEKVVIFIDNGFSGGNVNRDGFQKMMRLVRQGNVSKVMVYKLNPIRSEAEQVRYLFEGYAREAVSLRRLVDVLNTKGKLPLDSSHWTTAKISNLLKNHFCESRLQRVRLFRPAWNENRHKYVPVHRRMGYSTLWPHQTPTRQSGLVRCAAGPIEPPRDCGFRHLAQMSA